MIIVKIPRTLTECHGHIVPHGERNPKDGPLPPPTSGLIMGEDNSPANSDCVEFIADNRQEAIVCSSRPTKKLAFPIKNPRNLFLHYRAHWWAGAGGPSPGGYTLRCTRSIAGAGLFLLRRSLYDKRNRAG